MDLECGKVPKVTLTQASGETEKLMGMEFTPGLMEIDTKVNSKHA